MGTETKAAFQTLFLKSLYETVIDYIKKHNKTVTTSGEQLSIGKIVEKEIKRLIEEDIPLPYNPSARVMRYSKLGKYSYKRSQVYLKPSDFAYFNEELSKRAQAQFKEDINIQSTTAYGNLALYLFCKRKGLPIKEESFFSNEGYKDTKEYECNQILTSMQNMYALLGRRPTVREWNKLRHKVNGPSYSKLVSTFDSYSKAWDKAEMFNGRKERTEDEKDV